jgi:16S rRNA processing protein RimM
MTDTKPDPNKPRRILLGQIAGAHGIRGDVLVRTFTGEPAAIASYGPLTDASGAKTFKLRVVRVTDKGIVARVEGVNDRNGAEAIRGQELYVDRTKLPAPAETEYYHADLIGLTAVTEDGKELGHVMAIQNFGAGDLVEIQLTGSKSTDLIPFTNANVPDIDLAGGRMTVIPPVMVGEPEPASGENEQQS